MSTKQDCYSFDYADGKLNYNVIITIAMFSWALSKNSIIYRTNFKTFCHKFCLLMHISVSTRFLSILTNYLPQTVHRKEKLVEHKQVDFEGCITIRITGFLDYVHRPVLQKIGNITFRKLGLFPSSCEGGKTFTQLGPLGRTNLNHWATPVKITTAI
jgi:hypothetical protein